MTYAEGTRRLRIVGIGGGTGLPVLLRGLRILAEHPYGEAIQPVAIVSVSDNGGSSGRLRKALSIPAVGDLRNCLVALSPADASLADIFQYRLTGDWELSGHCLGNLIVTALLMRLGGLGEAIRAAEELLQVKGRVMPCTEHSTTLCAESDDGAAVLGETQIAEARRSIRRMWLEPGNPSPAPGVIEAILDSDAIVFGPGSLYTSIVPNLLVKGVPEAVRASRAAKIVVVNLMTEPGQTGGFSAADHVRVIAEHLGGGIDACVVNSRPLPASVLRHYASHGIAPVILDETGISRCGARPVAADLLADGEFKARHDPFRLARLIADLAQENARAGNCVSIGSRSGWLRSRIARLGES